MVLSVDRFGQFVNCSGSTELGSLALIFGMTILSNDFIIISESATGGSHSITSLFAFFCMIVVVLKYTGTFA